MSDIYYLAAQRLLRFEQKNWQIADVNKKKKEKKKKKKKEKKRKKQEMQEASRTPSYRRGITKKMKFCHLGS